MSSWCLEGWASPKANTPPCVRQWLLKPGGRTSPRGARAKAQLPAPCTSLSPDPPMCKEPPLARMPQNSYPNPGRGIAFPAPTRPWPSARRAMPDLLYPMPCTKYLKASASLAGCERKEGAASQCPGVPLGQDSDIFNVSAVAMCCPCDREQMGAPWGLLSCDHDLTPAFADGTCYPPSPTLSRLLRRPASRAPEGDGEKGCQFPFRLPSLPSSLSFSTCNENRAAPAIVKTCFTRPGGSWTGPGFQAMSPGRPSPCSCPRACAPT